MAKKKQKKIQSPVSADKKTYDQICTELANMSIQIFGISSALYDLTLRLIAIRERENPSVRKVKRGKRS